MGYRLGILSPIPVVQVGGPFRTLDLWARDLDAQVHQVKGLRLFCPSVDAPPRGWTGLAPVPPEIELVDIRLLRGSGLSAAIAGCHVLQVPGGEAWRSARLARRLVREGHRAKIPTIVGISSNRAGAALLNARGMRPLARLSALFKGASIWAAQRQLTASADGTFVVGDGLTSLVSPRCPALHVSVASWVRDDDLDAAQRRAECQETALPLDRLCIASRLEYMKGVHVGIDAFARIRAAEERGEHSTLTILGAGTQRAALERQASDAGLGSDVRFGGTRSYPIEFFDELGHHGLVLLTNLSDEQPRLVFDAVTQGCLPVCPDSPAYASLGLPRALFYRQGDAASMADAVRRLQRHPDARGLLRQAVAAARGHTLDAMHRARASWIEREVLACQATASARAA